MEKEMLNKILDEHKEWIETEGENGTKANLRDAELRSADLSGADLSEADLRGADLDYSAFPLWCGGLDVHIDDRQATQLLFHLVRNVLYSKNTSKSLKKLCSLKLLVSQANRFHRVDECGHIEKAKKALKERKEK